MFSLPYMRTIVPIFAVVAIIALGAYVNLTVKQARYVYSGPVTISVVGKGEATAVPNIATFSFSVHAEDIDAATAQSKSATAMNAIIDYLKGANIEEKDIKTEYYNLNPRYEYPNIICADGVYCPPGERVLRGYEVDQSVSVKVRDTSKAGELISGVGERGATNVSGIQFTIDDEDNIKAEAREEAIADAQAKAEKLAGDLGVRIVRMTGFWEDQGAYPYGYGGAEMGVSTMAKDAAVAPSIPVGENTVTAQVNISYEVR